MLFRSASHLNSSLLARAHHAIDRLGGSLAAGLAELEAARRSFAAERAAHVAECRRLAASRREVQEARTAVEEGWQPAATEAALLAAAAKEMEAEARLQAAADAERELALCERELTRTATVQQTERARLEQLEEVLVSRQEALDRRESNLHAEADARLVKKRDAMEEEFTQKAKDIHAQECDANN